MFARDHSTGALSQAGCWSDNGTNGLDGTDGVCVDANALRGAKAVAVSPDGRDVYVAAGRSGALDVFRTGADGGLTQSACIKESAVDSICADGRALAGARDVAVAPDGKHVYVAAAGANGVSAFARDPASGALTELQCVSETGSDGACDNGQGLRGAASLAFSPDGRRLYVAAVEAGALVTFARDSLSGRLRQIGCRMQSVPRVGTCDRTRGLRGAYAVTAAGQRVYVASRSAGTVLAFRLTGPNGRLARVGCATAFDRIGACTRVAALAGASALAASGGRVVVGVDQGLVTLEPSRRVAGLRARGCASGRNPRRDDCTLSPGLVGVSGIALTGRPRLVYAAAASADALVALREPGSG